MRLFGKINSAIDRFDRAQWLTPPFDLAWSSGLILVIATSTNNDLAIRTNTHTDLQLATETQ